jgi:DNA-binding NarL/FixJ family response regulator
MNTRVLLVDDCEIVREGLRLMLQRELGLEIVGGAEDGATALAKARGLLPDLILMDMELGDMDGIEASRQILAALPQIRILIMSGLVDTIVVNEGLKVGIKGFLLKTSAAQELFRAIRTVVEGYSYLSPNVSETVLANYKDLLARSTPPRSLLTKRERDVLKLTAEGLRMKEIANQLGIGVKTVETHRADMMRKLECGSSAELTRYAIREGISPI